MCSCIWARWAAKIGAGFENIRAWRHLRRWWRHAGTFADFGAALAIVLRANICPAVCFLHVLFAVALTFAFIRTWMILALVHGWRHRVLVIDVTVALFLSGPAMMRILATRLVALPGTRVRLLVFPQQICARESLMAVSAGMSCLICVYTVSTAIHLHCSGVHLRAARTCRARFSCREYVLWHCVHTCICRRQDKRVRV